MKPGPFGHGSALGYALPLLVLAPALFAGAGLDVIAQGRTLELLPSFALLLAPGAVAGFLAARFYSQRRDTWRFGVGLFAGASLAGALLFWVGADAYGPFHRIITSLLGGPYVAGFWIWLGSILGTALGYARAERPRGIEPVADEA